MNKIKRIWQENKVLLVLAIILVVCIVVLVGVSLKFFYGSSESVYGNRLDTIKDNPIKEENLNSIKATLKENEKVDNVNITVKGKIVYINIKYIDDVKMSDGKKIAEGTIDSFSESELENYDIQYTISSKLTKEDKDNKSYTLMGSRNSNGLGEIVWNNYNIKETEE